MHPELFSGRTLFRMALDARMFGTGAVRDGFSRRELIAVVACLVVLAAILLPWFRTAQVNRMQLDGGSQLRGVMQSLENWANDQRQMYPVPSKIDVDNTTVPDLGAAKDTTSNIFALLLWNQHLPSALIERAPRNAPWFEPYENTGAAVGAVHPSRALWDPSFSADFSGGNKANIGIAHAPIRDMSGHVHPLWRGLRNSSSPVLSERGAEITGTRSTPGMPDQPIYANPDARMVSGSSGQWEGSIAFGDVHVEFSLTPAAPAVQIQGHGPSPADWLFLVEPGATVDHNAFLGIYRKAGEKPSDFEAIWD